MFRKQSEPVMHDIIEVAERLGRILSRDSVHAQSMIARTANRLSYDPRSII